MSLLIGGCATSRGRTLVSDLGNGATEYRAIQGEIREGEADLAIAGAKIEEELGNLEQSIGASQGAEQEIGDIIQRIRNRPVDTAFIEEWRNRQIKNGYFGGEAGKGKI
jgi:hypothetical protein